MHVTAETFLTVSSIKRKVAPTTGLTKIGFLAVSPQVILVINSAVGCHYFSPVQVLESWSLPQIQLRGPVFTNRGKQGVFPPVLSSLVMTNCPPMGVVNRSRSRDVLIFWRIYVSANISKTVQDRDIRPIED